MKVIELKCGLKAMVDDDDFERLNKYKWRSLKGHSTTYAVRSQYMGGGRSNPKRNKTFFMHRDILQVDDKLILVDHEDHNGLNNQKSNIRKCTKAQNQKNKRSEINSTSQYLGVDFQPTRNRWRARIRLEGKDKHLGRFINEIDAAKAYDAAARLHHKEFANPNFK